MEQILNDLTNQILQILILAIVAWIGNELRQALQALTKKFMTSASLEQRELLKSIVTSGVKAAEQIANSAEVGNLYVNKKAEAIDRIQGELSQRGIKLDLGVTETMVEAAVLEEFNRTKELLMPASITVTTPTPAEAPVEAQEGTEAVVAVEIPPGTEVKRTYPFETGW